MSSNRPYLLRAVHEWICDNGLTPYIVVDASAPGLAVPPQAVSDGRVVLNLAPRAVARLEIGNETITCMARFGGVSQSVQVPVAAVQAIYARENGQGMLLAADGGDAPAAEAADGADPGEPAAPVLQAVPSGTRQDEGEAPSDDDGSGAPDAGDRPGSPPPKGKPNLRVIK